MVNFGFGDPRANPDYGGAVRDGVLPYMAFPSPQSGAGPFDPEVCLSDSGMSYGNKMSPGVFAM